ncbi:MAG TPA: iron uptake transporter permease EfeU [Frankiaceae bacterium]|nr:iron uptake transporter permease EfeU [Frankiaceae bacterium]
MLATFVIGLREGLEAALIVGIVAAFLKQQGGAQARQALRWVWIGVLSAVLICLAVGIVLRIVSADLPQRQQEGLETVIGAVAVAMVTYMVVWMRRHSRDLKGQLEGAAGSALAQGSAKALIAMAFLAVLREGLETAVFLLAAFNASGNGLTAGIGALLGILVATLLGYGIYRGGVRINLSRFFRATGLVLVVVAAGLVMTALHTAHEAGWLNAGQDRLFDISWLVRNGSVQASLITGVLGIQPMPAVVEVVGWLVYLLPVGVYVGWPPGRRVPWRAVSWASLGAAAACAVGAVSFAIAAPSAPGAPPGSWTTPVSGSSVPVTWTTSGAKAAGHDVRGGVNVDVLTRQQSQAVTGAGLPASVTAEQLRQLNGGRLPIGVSAAEASGRVALSYLQTATDTLYLDSRTDRLIDASRRVTVTATAKLSSGPLVLENVRDTTAQPTAAARADLASADQHVLAVQARARSWGSDYPTLFGIAAVVLAVLSAGSRLWLRRARADVVDVTASSAQESDRESARERLPTG